MEYEKRPIIDEDKVQRFFMGAECGGHGEFEVYEGVIIFSCLNIPAGMARNMFTEYDKIHNFRECKPDWNAVAEVLIECRYNANFNEFLEILDKDSEEYKALKSAIENCIAARIFKLNEEIDRWKSLLEKY